LRPTLKHSPENQTILSRQSRVSVLSLLLKEEQSHLSDRIKHSHFELSLSDCLEIEGEWKDDVSNHYDSLRTQEISELERINRSR
jgi:hypothetical protein